MDERAAAIRAAAIDDAGKTGFESVRAAALRVASLPRRNPAACAIAATALVAAAGIAFPGAAFAVAAAEPELSLDPVSWGNWISWFVIYGLLGSFANMALASSFALVSMIGIDGTLLASFSSMLTSEGHSFATYASYIADVIVKPCAYTILAMAVLVQLVSVARRMDQQGGTLPAVREVLGIVVFYAVFLALVSNAEVIVQGMYELVRAIIGQVDAYMGSMESQTLGFTAINWPDDMAVGDMVVVVLLSLAVVLLSLVYAVYAGYCAIARALEIYLLTMLSPIPFAFMGFEGTRQWGAGFIKEFLAVCLSGVFLVFILYASPVVFATFVEDFTPAGGSGGLVVLMSAQMIPWIVRVIAVELALFVALKKSGQLARSVLGG